MKIKRKLQKQGNCGSFCFLYYLNNGCPDDCQYDYKRKVK